MYFGVPHLASDRMDLFERKTRSGRPSRPKRRKFCGNQSTTPTRQPYLREPASSTKKLAAASELETDAMIRYHCEHAIMDLKRAFSKVEECDVCKKCGSHVICEKGSVFKLVLQCCSEECGETTEINF